MTMYFGECERCGGREASKLRMGASDIPAALCLPCARDWAVYAQPLDVFARLDEMAVRLAARLEAADEDGAAAMQGEIRNLRPDVQALVLAWLAETITREEDVRSGGKQS